MAFKENQNCEDCKEVCCARCFHNDSQSVFSRLTKDDLEVLMGNRQSIRFSSGETILKQNTSSTHVVCMKRGLAKVYIEGMNGKKLILKIIGELDFICGGGIFANNVRHFTVSALTDVECCFIDSERILRLFSENSNFAIELMKHHNEQNSALLNTLVNLTQKYMHGRVADTLLYLKNDVFRTNPFQLPISRQELADMSAMAKESYVRILKEFKTSGIIKPNGNSMEILNEEALISISKNG
ncbi:MAG: Crp/Fnr family transcriptional regulator [Prolixibacteraceae bacterium]|nr:Crp/Fnr family transcriptional regulator [Prolixibacteraceae bacterium]